MAASHFIPNANLTTCGHNNCNAKMLCNVVDTQNFLKQQRKWENGENDPVLTHLDIVTLFTSSSEDAKMLVNAADNLLNQTLFSFHSSISYYMNNPTSS